MADKRGKAIKKEAKRASKSFLSFIEQRIEDISDDLQEISGKIEKKEKEQEKRQFNLLGFLWPVISAGLGILCLLFVVILLNIININLESYFIAALAALFYNNLYLFFSVSLFFGYADYIRLHFSKIYWLVEPIINALGVVAVLWIFITALNLANPYAANNFLMILANVIYLILDRVFLLFLVLGYMALLIRIITRETGKLKK